MIKINAALYGTVIGVTMYSYPELRKEPLQLAHAILRAQRCARAGTLMGIDYYFVRNKSVFILFIKLC